MNNKEKKNKKLGEELLKSMTNSAETFKKWTSISQMLMEKLTDDIKGISALNEFNRALATLDKAPTATLDKVPTDVSNKIEDEPHTVETIEVDLAKINIDVEDWEDGDVKPVKAIVSCLFGERKHFGVMSEPSDAWFLTDAILPFNVKFSVKDIVLVMEDGTFRICNKEDR